MIYNPRAEPLAGERESYRRIECLDSLTNSSIPSKLWRIQ